MKKKKDAAPLIPWLRAEIQLTPRQLKQLAPIFTEVDAAYERFREDGYGANGDTRCSVLGQVFRDGAASFYLVSPSTSSKIIRATTKMKKNECIRSETSQSGTRRSSPKR